MATKLLPSSNYKIGLCFCFFLLCVLHMCVCLFRWKLKIATYRFPTSVEKSKDKDTLRACKLVWTVLAIFSSATHDSSMNRKSIVLLLLLPLLLCLVIFFSSRQSTCRCVLCTYSNLCVCSMFVNRMKWFIGIDNGSCDEFSISMGRTTFLLLWSSAFPYGSIIWLSSHYKHPTPYQGVLLRRVCLTSEWLIVSLRNEHCQCSLPSDGFEHTKYEMWR